MCVKATKTARASFFRFSRFSFYLILFLFSSQSTRQKEMGQDHSVAADDKFPNRGDLYRFKKEFKSCCGIVFPKGQSAIVSHIGFGDRGRTLVISIITTRGTYSIPLLGNYLEQICLSVDNPRLCLDQKEFHPQDIVRTLRETKFYAKGSLLIFVERGVKPSCCQVVGLVGHVEIDADNLEIVYCAL